MPLRGRNGSEQTAIRPFAVPRNLEQIEWLE
jgi:hypothetical protein